MSTPRGEDEPVVNEAMLNEAALRQARAGAPGAFGELTEPHRRELLRSGRRGPGPGEPIRQRITLVLRDVLGFRAAEVADMLQTSQDSVNSALRRARAALSDHQPADRAPRTSGEREVTDRFVAAFERGDVDAIVGLLTDDAWLTMPPLPFEYQGHDAIAEFLSTVGFRGGTRRTRLVATGANGQPAYGCYLLDPHAPIARANGMIVLTMSGNRIAALTRFLDNSRAATVRTAPEHPCRPAFMRQPVTPPTSVPT